MFPYKKDEELLKYYKGYSFPGWRYLKPEHVEASINYTPLDDDIVLTGFPKTGNSWVSLIIWTILHKNEMSNPLHYYVNETKEAIIRRMELCGVEPVKALKAPRFYSTHIPYNLLSINPKAKYIYTYRRPEDTALSYFQFFGPLSIPEYDFDTFFSHFLEGAIVFGHYFSQVLEAYAHKDDGHVLMVSFEKLKAQPKEEIFRIAKFLGENYYESLAADPQFLSNFLEWMTFEYMKQNLKMPSLQPDINGAIQSLIRFRKGVVGDGKKALTEQQYKRLQEVITETMSGTELLDEWLK